MTNLPTKAKKELQDYFDYLSNTYVSKGGFVTWRHIVTLVGNKLTKVPASRDVESITIFL